MTDNEIIKADELISKLHKYCLFSQMKMGELNTFTDSDFDCLHNLIDTINRQKAEIERLEKSKGFTDLGKLYSEIKSEARKEFWERLKEKRYGGTYPYVLITEGDNLLKEME